VAVSGIAALQGLDDARRVEPGQRVLNGPRKELPLLRADLQRADVAWIRLRMLVTRLSACSYRSLREVSGCPSNTTGISG